MAESVLVGLGLVVVVATLLPLLRREDWWIRIFDFPRLQITVLAAAVLVAYVVVREGRGLLDNVFLALLTGALLYQCWRMFPYTPLAKKQVQQSRLDSAESRVSLLFANVLMTNRDAETLKRLVREADPDIVLAVETDAWWQKALGELERTHPHTVQNPLDNTYGMLLYSRLPLHGAEVKFLVQQDIPSIHARVELRTGQQIELRCVHPRPPAPSENDRSTERDAELLIVGKEIKAKKAPAIVLGDLNDVAWSHTTHLFNDVSGMLDPRVGRGFYPTFNAKWPLVRFPLDHCFHSPHFRLVDFRRLPAGGSDHFPVYICLSFEPEAEASQPHLHADAEERREAEKKISEV